LPGLGIVAAVLGVVLTMGKIKEPPEILGASIGAALVGTFMGVLLCYGFVGPMAKNMEFIANEDLQYLNVIKVALLAFIGGGAAPKVAVEFGRRVIPSESKPSFLEMEDALRAAKK
jgi:chemotaxis protein MotA